MRLVVATVVILLAMAGSAASATSLPTIGGEFRPAHLGNGDGSQMWGGLDGNGRTSLGHIRWTRWSATEAVGLAWAWDRGPKPCALRPKGCGGNDPFLYKLDSKRPFRIAATRPVKRVFLHLVVGHSCLLWRGRRVGYYPVSCHTWRS